MNNYSYAYPPAKQPIGFGKIPTPDFPHGKTPALPKNPQLAMAYVPFQTEFITYDEMKALKEGTLFPCLDKPFHGCGKR